MGRLTEKERWSKAKSLGFVDHIIEGKLLSQYLEKTQENFVLKLGALLEVVWRI